jgi:hypothetical protein
MSAEKIRALNDAFRRTLSGGQVMMTAGIAALPDAARAKVLNEVRTFDAFTADNDPHCEHDFGSFKVDGRKIFWKIDAYDAAMEFGSEDPADTSKTTRVLTIMFAANIDH